MKQVKVIAFDADDTLWINESHFQNIETEFYELLKDFLPKNDLAKELYKTEMQNIHIYGYGAKSFTLSMIETAVRISDNKIGTEYISQIVDFGKSLLDMPIELLSGVDNVLESLHGKYKLAVATKGDLLDQERKLKKSGIKDYFHHVEIMSNKQSSDYENLINSLKCTPNEFLMIGNSLKSDILPVLEIGAYGAHIPFEVTWIHEKVDEPISNSNFIQLSKINEILDYLD